MKKLLIIALLSLGAVCLDMSRASAWLGDHGFCTREVCSWPYVPIKTPCQFCPPLGPYCQSPTCCPPIMYSQMCQPMMYPQMCQPMTGTTIIINCTCPQMCRPMNYPQMCQPMNYPQMCRPMMYPQMCQPICCQPNMCSPMMGSPMMGSSPMMGGSQRMGSQGMYCLPMNSGRMSGAPRSCGLINGTSICGDTTPLFSGIGDPSNSCDPTAPHSRLSLFGKLHAFPASPMSCGPIYGTSICGDTTPLSNGISDPCNPCDPTAPHSRLSLFGKLHAFPASTNPCGDPVQQLPPLPSFGTSATPAPANSTSSPSGTSQLTPVPNDSTVWWNGLPSVPVQVVGFQSGYYPTVNYGYAPARQNWPIPTANPQIYWNGGR